MFNQDYDEQLRVLTAAYPIHYVRMLKAAKKPKYAHLLKYIYDCTPMLDDEHYKLSTRVYWVLHHLTDFPVCQNSKCKHGGKITNWNPPHLDTEFKRFCCRECQYTSTEYRDAVAGGFESKYGTGIRNAFQIPDVIADLKERAGEIDKQKKATRLKHFGCETFNNTDQAQRTKIDRYGSIWNTAKIAETKLQRHGSAGWNNSAKRVETQRQNGTLNTSSAEDCAYEILKFFKFPDVVRQYKSDSYPFCCDFYSPSADTYIEYLGSWTHGGHPYDPSSDSDEEVVQKWKAGGTEYYANALETWTVRDVLKRQTAASNKLNYIELWNIADVCRYVGIDLGDDHYLMVDWDSETARKELEWFKNMHQTELQSNTTQYNYLVKYFQQDVFYRAEKMMWCDPIVRAKLIPNRCHYLKKTKSALTDIELLRGFKIAGMHYGYSFFNPAIMNFFCNKYGVRICYDPCGGWGHRMLGALGIEKYIYNDASPTTKANVDRLVKWGKIPNTTTYCNDAREFVPVEQFDAMFTCPPYYNVEHYECGDFTTRLEYDDFIRSLIKTFLSRDDCRVFGMVIREDLLPTDCHIWSEQFELTPNKKGHLTNRANNYKEKLYIFTKDH